MPAPPPQEAPLRVELRCLLRAALVTRDREPKGPGLMHLWVPSHPGPGKGISRLRGLLVGGRPVRCSHEEPVGLNPGSSVYWCVTPGEVWDSVPARSLPFLLRQIWYSLERVRVRITMCLAHSQSPTRLGCETSPPEAWGQKEASGSGPTPWPARVWSWICGLPWKISLSFPQGCSV